jgi:ATP-dependent Clp protease adaptor protein ClpS
MWKVVLHNDERTTLDFLAEVIVSIFSRRQAEAANLLLKLYREGRVVAGIYNDVEVASNKVAAVRALGEAKGQILIATVEEVRRSRAA